MATMLMRPAEGGESGDKKRRARKGKNAQKKQPQRGLGVAQLEKLRLQEQSLLCPASPSAFSLRLCANPSDHPVSRCDGAVAQTVLSLTPSNGHAQHVGAVRGSSGSSAGAVRPGEAAAAGAAMSRLSAFSGHASAQSCLPPSGVVQDISRGNAEAIDVANRAVASRAMGCQSQSSKFPSSNASFSSVLTSPPLQIFEGTGEQHGQRQKLEERRAAAVGAAGDQVGRTAFYVFPNVSNHVKEAGSQVNDAGFKVHPVFKHHVGTSPSIERTNSTKELSSFQSYAASQQAWSAPEKITGRKRPWLALQESSSHACHAQALDLNAPLGESDVSHSERHSPNQLNQSPQSRAGAHYTTGIVRSALGNSCLTLGSKVKVCSSMSPWQDSDGSSPASAYFSDMGMYSESGTSRRHCLGQSSVKDSCSSATGSGTYLTLDRKRCLNDPQISFSVAAKESICSNFLTLGIASSSYPDRNGCNEPEESIQDNSLMSGNDLSRLKQLHDSTTFGCEGDNEGSPIRKSGCKQDVGVLDLEGIPSRCFPLEYGGGNYKRRTSVLCESNLAISPGHPNRFPPIPPPSMASNSPGTADQSPSDHHAYDPSATSARASDDILDLRLKLAL